MDSLLTIHRQDDTEHHERDNPLTRALVKSGKYYIQPIAIHLSLPPIHSSYRRPTLATIMIIHTQSWNNSVAKHVVQVHNNSSGQLRPTLLPSSGLETLDGVTFLSCVEKHSASFLSTPSQILQQPLPSAINLSGEVLTSAILTSWTALFKGIANTTSVSTVASSVDAPGIAVPSNISDGQSLLALATQTKVSRSGASVVSTLRPTATMVATAQNLSDSVRLLSSKRILSVTGHHDQALKQPNVTATTSIINLHLPVATLLVPGSSNQTHALANASGLAIVSSTGNPSTANASRAASTSVQTVYIASVLSNPDTVDTYQASFILLSGLRTSIGPSSATQSEASVFAANVSNPSNTFSSIFSSDNATSKSSTVAPTSFNTTLTAMLPADSSTAANPIFQESKTAQFTKQQTAGVAVGGVACLIIALLVAVFLIRRCWANKNGPGRTTHTYEEPKRGSDDAEVRGTICTNSPKATAYTRLPESAHTNGYRDQVRNVKDQYAQIVMERVVFVQHPSIFSDRCNAALFSPDHSNVIPELSPTSNHSTVPPQTQFSPRSSVTSYVSHMSCSSRYSVPALGNTSRVSPYQSNSSRTILSPNCPDFAPPIDIGWNEIKSEDHTTGSDLLSCPPSPLDFEYSQ